MVNRYLVGALVTGAVLFGSCDDKPKEDLEKMVNEPVAIVQRDDSNDLQVRQRLSLISEDISEDKSPRVEKYFVQSGDIFGKIANDKFGMKIAEMRGINPNVKDIGNLSIGQELNVINYTGVDTGMADVLKYKTNDFSGDSDKVLLARLLYAETLGCSKADTIDVALSVLNRIGDGKDWNGETVRDVILCPKQYSCFNKGSEVLKKLKNPVRYDANKFKESLEIAGDVLARKYDYLNKEQTHFYNPDKCSPYWKDDKSMTKLEMGGPRAHVFLREN